MTEFGLEGLVEFKWRTLQDGRRVRMSKTSHYTLCLFS